MGVAAAAMRMSVQYGNSQAVYSESRHTSGLLLCVNLFTLLAIESSVMVHRAIEWLSLFIAVMDNFSLTKSLYKLAAVDSTCLLQFVVLYMSC